MGNDVTWSDVSVAGKHNCSWCLAVSLTSSLVRSTVFRHKSFENTQTSCQTAPETDMYVRRLARPASEAVANKLVHSNVSDFYQNTQNWFIASLSNHIKSIKTNQIKSNQTVWYVRRRFGTTYQIRLFAILVYTLIPTIFMISHDLFFKTFFFPSIFDMILRIDIILYRCWFFLFKDVFFACAERRGCLSRS